MQWGLSRNGWAAAYQLAIYAHLFGPNFPLKRSSKIRPHLRCHTLKRRVKECPVATPAGDASAGGGKWTLHGRGGAQSLLQPLHNPFLETEAA